MATSKLSRRVLIQGLVVASAATGAAAASPLNGPPTFGTARQQFRIVRPARIVPDISMSRLGGPPVSFTSFRGKVVLLNFWATWCPACRTELPILDRLQKDRGGNNLQVVAVSVDRTGRHIPERYVRERNIRHLLVGLDPDERLTHSPESQDKNAPFALYGMPISYVIGRSGRIEGYLIGEADWTSEAALNLLGHYIGQSA